MNQLKYAIGYDESISRWWITDMKREPFASPYKTFEADVNLEEGYVQIVYPVREEFLKVNKIENVSYYNGSYDRVFFPFENNRIDFTTFIHTPHYIWTNAKTHIFVEKAGKYPFELYTCGGMKIWVNQKEVECFTPYTRNIPGKKTIELALKQGLNEIAVYADELAERDVFFYFEMRYKGGTPIFGVIELEERAELVLQTERFLKSCYFEKDGYREGNLILQYDKSLLKNEVTLYLTDDKGKGIGKHNDVLTGTAYTDKSEIDFGPVTGLKVGAYKVLVKAMAGRYPIARDLRISVMPKDFIPFHPGKTVEERKQQALSFISDYGADVIITTMAILETKKKWTKEADIYFRNSFMKISKKEDCSDFYLAAMMMLAKRYREYISDELYEEIHQLVLGFRYWIDEPGNDVMWYFSENHAMLFHLAQYLGGGLYPDDTFTVSGRKGKEQYAIGKKRLMDWFHTFFQYGYAEWNSATYIPVDLIGFFVLYEMAPDKDMKDIAKKALDYTFRIISYNMFEGVMSSSYGRAYEETLKAREQIEPNFLEWVTTGVGHLTLNSRAVTLYCLSDYLPPNFSEDTKVQPRGWISAELDQGINRVKTYYYKTSQYFMASVKGYKAFEHGHQQHLMNIAFGKNSAQFFINHPGERPYSGGNRPAYWSGNGTNPYIEQYKNLMILLFHIDENELVHYIHGYTPMYDYEAFKIEGSWLFLRNGDAYMGTYFNNGYQLVTEGANTGKEVISLGLNHCVIIKGGSREEFISFENFCETLKHTNISYDGNLSVTVNDIQYGEVKVKALRELYVENERIEYCHKPEIEIKKGILSHA
ncbi:hypothetical protein acsn021_43300 [Anaerocolumna cellulosilytica]|uniref:Uncharacterized protein n=1 Tax=Anaerocolumna cellulosilytica TaxID=433286 RepID=A0A6S6RDG6_9FIRM|nr:hypothetical protein [Anaerocolumna cellulosilytica]MBB5195288.1 hypothetical protein [Anaerocolumna cellulosilytica]BCJ96761.1 hypothetical protein acsn021_43300 [Anaerocolumna cellulosilytica]